MQENDVEKHDKSMIDFEVPDVIAEIVRTKWTDPVLREVEQVCAQHKAELMHTNAIITEDEDAVKSFD